MTKSLQSQPKWLNKILPLLFVLFGLLLFLRLGRDPLYDWDEAIYGQLGRELIDYGNIWTNSYNSNLWFEKPPGISWVAGLGLTFFGGEFGARFAMPIFAALTLYGIYLIGKKLSSWIMGLISAGILGTLGLFLDRSRALNTDMPLLLGIVSTCVVLLFDLSPIFLALTISFSIWFKGVAGLLAVLISLPLLLTKGKKYLTSSAILTSLLLIPWHLYSYLKYRNDFISPYFLEQVVARVTNPIEFHLESRYYYLNFLYENLGIGVILVAILGGYFVLCQYLRSRSAQDLLVLWWLIIPILVFTLARTRLFWYILPVYPAASLLCGYAITYFANSKQARKVIAILAIGIFAQSLLSAYRYVDYPRSTPTTTNQLTVVRALSTISSDPLVVLVSPSERVAEAILPESQRISSSFRYGGSPSTLYYYQNQVIFFYNTDYFQAYLNDHPDGVIMLVRDDLSLLDPEYQIVSESGDYLGVKKEAK